MYLYKICGENFQRPRNAVGYGDTYGDGVGCVFPESGSGSGSGFGSGFGSGYGWGMGDGSGSGDGDEDGKGFGGT